MREIKFRGIPNGETAFVYGGHCEIGDRHFIIPADAEYDPDCGGFEPAIFGVIEVIPESVGQYTGLKDKNGAEIYEGDRLQTIADDGTRLSSFEVYWREGAASFAKKRDDGEDFWLDQVACQHLEVIGNVHQHPELLEQK